MVTMVMYDAFQDLWLIEGMDPSDNDNNDAVCMGHLSKFPSPPN